MNNRVLVLGACLAAAGCAAPVVKKTVPEPLLPEQRTAMQARGFPASYDAVFAATISVIQDLGWNLQTADKSSGIIKIASNRRLEKLSPTEESIVDFDLRLKTIRQRSDPEKQWSRWEEMTIHAEPLPGGQAQERIVIVRRGSLPPMSYPGVMGGGFLKSRKQVVINAPSQEVNAEMDLPEVYGDFFDRVQKALSIRMPAP